MKPHILIFAFLVLQAVISNAQVNHKKSFELVLKQNKIGKEISFSKTKPNDHDSLALIYLGEIKTRKGHSFKIITSRWYWGYAPHATSRIVVFDKRNQYLGDYYLTMTYDTPDKIEGSFLVFVNNKESDCSSNLVTKVNFEEGIPKQIFLKCKGESGDICSFSRNL